MGFGSSAKLSDNSACSSVYKGKAAINKNKKKLELFDNEFDYV